MAIQYKKNAAHFDGNISVEDAEELLGWIQKTPKAKPTLPAAPICMPPICRC